MSGSAITSQGKGNPSVYVPMEGTPACPFCKKTEYIKAEILNMSTVRAVFECVSCGLFRISKPEEQEIWAKMKGRIAPQPPQSCATVIDFDAVAKATNIVYQ